MKFVADLHLHSKYSRAVSKDMVLPIMYSWAKKKGIDILATSDWTHPLWFREIQAQLEETGEGVYKLKRDVILNSFQDLGSDGIPKQVRNDRNNKKDNEPLFLLSVEVSSIYSQNGKLRRIHSLIFAPNFEIAEKINKELVSRGVNLMSDGRPIMGLSAQNLLELTLAIDKRVIFIPAHAWTPHFGIFGSASGFDSLEECFGSFAKYVYGVETGLSSDPWMNWQIKDLQSRSILSFSDAHSPAKMGREATVFVINKNGISNSKFPISNDKEREITYMDIGKAIANPTENCKVAYTIEFYPEEGKYHYSGHRNCGVVEDPTKVKETNHICRVCGRRLTEGVMYRLGQLSKSAKFKAQSAKLDGNGVNWTTNEEERRPPFVRLVPLNEIIAESLSSTVMSEKVKKSFDDLCSQFGSEINVLLNCSIADIAKFAGEKVAHGIEKVRSGNITVEPGYDGEYGKVKIWNHEEEKSDKQQEISSGKKTQLGLF